MALTSIFLLSLSEIFGDFSLKKYTTSDKTIYLILGLIGYATVIFFLLRALRESKTVLYVNGMWDGINAVIASVFAIIIGERLGAPKQYLGLVFIIVGLFFLYDK